LNFNFEIILYFILYILFHKYKHITNIMNNIENFASADFKEPFSSHENAVAPTTLTMNEVYDAGVAIDHGTAPDPVMANASDADPGPPTSAPATLLNNFPNNINEVNIPYNETTGGYTTMADANSGPGEATNEAIITAATEQHYSNVPEPEAVEVAPVEHFSSHENAVTQVFNPLLGGEVANDHGNAPDPVMENASDAGPSAPVNAPAFSGNLPNNNEDNNAPVNATTLGDTTMPDANSGPGAATNEANLYTATEQTYNNVPEPEEVKEAPPFFQAGGDGVRLGVDQEMVGGQAVVEGYDNEQATCGGYGNELQEGGGSPFNFITDPDSGTTLSIFSAAGKYLLKSYVKAYKQMQSGGASLLEGVDANATGALYDGVEGAGAENMPGACGLTYDAAGPEWTHTQGGGGKCDCDKNCKKCKGKCKDCQCKKE
jgi:hypothetical protein